MGVTAEQPFATQTNVTRASTIAWQQYETAIRRWEALTGRTAPYPVERGTRGQPRLAAAFSEWLMGLPKGFVTDLANAQPVVEPKPQRRSHNQRADGGALVNYTEPENAGLPHKGKIGEAEAAFVRDNLELVNERRIAAGHAVIDPSNSEHARRYGFEG